MHEVPPYAAPPATTAVAEKPPESAPKSAETTESLRKKVAELESALNSLKPKKVDSATLPKFAVSWEFRRPVHSETDGSVSWTSEKIETLEDPRWDRMAGTVVSHGTLLVERLTYDEYGKIIGRAVHSSFQTQSVSDAKGRLARVLADNFGGN